MPDFSSETRFLALRRDEPLHLFHQNRVLTVAFAHNVSGRTGILTDERAGGPLARLVSQKCGCVWSECLFSARKRGFWQFGFIVSTDFNGCVCQNRVPTLALAQTVSGRTGHILDERAF